MIPKEKKQGKLKRRDINCHNNDALSQQKKPLTIKYFKK